MDFLSNFSIIEKSRTNQGKDEGGKLFPIQFSGIKGANEKRYHLPSEGKFSSRGLSPTFSEFIAPVEGILPTVTPMESGSNREITFTYDYQIKSLIYYHLEEHTSAKALLESMERDPFVRDELIPEEGLGKSTFYEVNNTRGVTQTIEVFDRLAKKVSRKLRTDHTELGDLIAVDGSLIDATLSMVWADYSSTKRKAKAHVGFDLNHWTPRKLILTDGKGNERVYLPEILEPGQTGVCDRGYQDHQLFDQLIDEGKHFVIRIKNNTCKEIIKELPFKKGGAIFFHAEVILGDQAHRMKHSVRLVGFRNHGKVYWVITDRTDLTAEQIAAIFALRWEIEKFFQWWKNHMKVYWLIARSEHGLMLQLLTGMITYLLFLSYCSRYFDEPPNLFRLRKLRWQIRTEAVISLVFIFFQVIFESLLEFIIQNMASQKP